MKKLLLLSLVCLIATAQGAEAVTWVEITIERLRPVNGRIWIYPNEDITSLLESTEMDGCSTRYLNVPMLTFDTSGTAAEKVSDMQAAILLYAAAAQSKVRLKLEGCVSSGGPSVSDLSLTDLANTPDR